MAKKERFRISRKEIQTAMEEFSKKGGKIEVLESQGEKTDFNPVNEQGFKNYYSSSSGAFAWGFNA